VAPGTAVGGSRSLHAMLVPVAVNVHRIAGNARPFCVFTLLTQFSMQIFVPVYDLSGAQEMSDVLWNTTDWMQVGRAGMLCAVHCWTGCRKGPPGVC